MTGNWERQGYVHLPLRAVAVVAIAVALASLAALVVVASIKDVDTLSTVALALAVIAFVAQLIVFVVQTNASNSQMLQSRALHAELLRLLATMDERARGTDAAVSTINERLLEAALGKVLPSSGGARPANVRQLARDVAEVLESSAHEQAGTAASTGREVRRRQYADEGIVQMLQSFPDAIEGQAAAEALEGLDPKARQLLKRFAQDEIETRKADATMAPGLSTVWPGSEELLEEGLIEKDPEGFALNVLTPKGRNIARLLTAKGEWPPWIADALRRLRDEEDEGDSSS